MPFLSAGTAIDASILGEIVQLVKTVMGLFTEFPINIFLYAGLAGVGFTIFKRAKKAAK
ncbi:hypothetical protein [Anaerocolumna sp.]|uniref:hypothetical protein n=1 Tax=Anaerocolumna sp. TaxID=2041569 RepID=UPI0028B0922F|nr:hypothetical protein [Anaerocolumna sp.]